METISGHIYDYPKYYDLVYGSDWKAEFDFLQACFEKHADRPVRRIFEPACGTGRLLVKLAEAGYDVSGNDLNPHAVEFCNARLERNGFKPTAFVGDMSDFRVKGKVDAAFNAINSFRELMSQRAAENHMRCVAASLAKGGLYVLGVHLTPTAAKPIDREEWSSRRGNLSVICRMWSKTTNLRKRVEHLGISFTIYTPTRHFRIEDDMDYRTYTAPQMRSLLKSVKEWEVVETYDFRYDIDSPIAIDAKTEDVVFVLRKR
jgi:SAM-dependent methyltransferase